MPSALGVLSLVFVTGAAALFQVVSARRSLSHLHRHRALELAARSAFEEAAARIENALAPVPHPPAGQLRSPGLETLTYPGRVTPVTTARDAALERIRISEVLVRWSGFRRTEHTDATGLHTLEYGIVQMETSATLETRAGSIRRVVCVRRNALRFRILPDNLICEVSDR